MPPQLSTDGFSHEAQWIAEATEQQRRNLRRSAVLGNEFTFDELVTVWDECKHPGWDGFESQPVEWETYHNAYRFLESLPLGAPAPSIGAEPDGELTLEWHRSTRHTLSVSVTQDGYLHYAALFGPNRMFGTVAFFGDAPNEILALIDRVDPA